MTTDIRAATPPAPAIGATATRRALSENIAREVILIDRSRALESERAGLDAVRTDRRNALARATADGADPKQLAALRRDLETATAREGEIREALQLLAADRAALIEHRKPLALAEAECALAAAENAGIAVAEALHTAVIQFARDVAMPLLSAWGEAYELVTVRRSELRQAGGDPGTMADRRDREAWYWLPDMDTAAGLLREYAGLPERVPDAAANLPGANPA